MDDRERKRLELWAAAVERLDRQAREEGIELFVSVFTERLCVGYMDSDTDYIEVGI